MNSVLFAALFVFVSAVLGDNKGSRAAVFSLVLDVQKGGGVLFAFDTAVFPQVDCFYLYVAALV